MVSEPFPEKHVAFPDGVAVAKPSSAGGNFMPGVEIGWGFDGPTLDAPVVFLHQADGRWFVTSHDYIPGPGPGDFVDEWRSADDAVSDILEFYFGDPARMAAKR